MPTYEYECSEGHRFEVEQRITEEPLEHCSVCNANARRLISATNFILKGGGWYSDGYSGRGGSSGSSDKSDKSSTSTTKSSSDSSASESKSSSGESSKDK